MAAFCSNSFSVNFVLSEFYFSEIFMITDNSLIGIPVSGPLVSVTLKLEPCGRVPSLARVFKDVFEFWVSVLWLNIIHSVVDSMYWNIYIFRAIYLGMWLQIPIKNKKIVIRIKKHKYLNIENEECDKNNTGNGFYYSKFKSLPKFTQQSYRIPNTIHLYIQLIYKLNL